MPTAACWPPLATVRVSRSAIEDGESCIRYLRIDEDPRTPAARARGRGADDGKNAILQTYFRNNVLHLFAMPSLMACCSSTTR